MDWVEIKILFFAKASELSGVREAVLSFPSEIEPTLLLKEIVEKFGLHDISNNILLALNEEYISTSNQHLLNLKEGDEIAVIPPISGG